MNNNMSYLPFSEIDINDNFFVSLIGDYPGFKKWFASKSKHKAYVQYNDEQDIEGFLYLKVEYDEVDDVEPIIYADKILKVGTFKIDAHGTRLGERFIKIILDNAIALDVDKCYVTIYSKHVSLIKLVQRYGFVQHGTKGKDGFQENVYVKDMRIVSEDINKSFPLINTKGNKKYLLSIYPKYHTIMFPDSILRTENNKIIADVSYTNSIHKIYVCSMEIDVLEYGDLVVMYRTAESGKSAKYSALVTSICVVEEVKLKSDFIDFEDFYKYSCQYSVFDKADLKYWYDKGPIKAVKLTYNLALPKRIIRRDLINDVGLNSEGYWGFFKLSDNQFNDIVTNAQVSKNIIV